MLATHRLDNWAMILLCCLAILALSACDNHGNNSTRDPNVVVNERDLKEDSNTLSPPIVQAPLYACTTAVVVQGFIPDASIEVFVNGASAGGGMSDAPAGQSFLINVTLVVGDSVTATQTFDGQTSDPSQAVIVASHTGDYPDGMPRPRISAVPLYECGITSGARDIVPGAKLTFSSEESSGSGFDPAVIVGTVNNSGAAQAISINPAFNLAARITAKYQICSDISPTSTAEIVQPEPATIPAPTIDPIYENSDRVVVRNTVNGARLRVFSNGVEVGGQGTSGGAGQQVRVTPDAQPGDVYTATQELCSVSTPSSGATTLPCSDLPPAKIKAPAAGDTRIEVTEFIAGSRIIIFAGGVEIGDGGGALIELYRPLINGEEIVVVQRLGDCESRFIYVIDVQCKVVETIPNPGNSGTYAVGSLDYNLPAITIGSDSVRLWATVRYPALNNGSNTDLIKTDSSLPIVMVLHGNHGIFRGPDDSDDNDIADDVCSGSGLPEVLNHEGYNYVLDSLAKTGIIAVSINANDLNCKSGRFNERADLILEHLSLWKGMHADTLANDPFAGKFIGAVDLSLIGLIGHSRGGEAVVRVPLRNSDSSFQFKGIISLAPTDAEAGNQVTDIPLLMILPAADGDVWDNSGAEIYDRSNSQSNSQWFRSQMYIYGANHNYFNQQWLEDDPIYDDGTAVAPSRLSRTAQERLLQGWSRTFFELTLKDKNEYLPIFSGDAELSGLMNDSVYTSFRSGQRQFVDLYQDSPDNIDRNSLNGNVIRNGSFLGFDEFTLRQGSTDQFNNTFFHNTDGLVVEWQKEMPNFVSRIPAANEDMSAYDNLTTRIAQVNDSRNRGLNRASEVMVIRLGITDRNNNHVDIETAGVGDIPYPYQHPFGAKSMMHTLRVPSACFVNSDGAAIDSSRTSDMTIKFDRTDQGTLAIDDIGFSQ